MQRLYFPKGLCSHSLWRHFLFATFPIFSSSSAVKAPPLPGHHTSMASPEMGGDTHLITVSDFMKPCIYCKTSHFTLWPPFDGLPYHICDPERQKPIEDLTPWLRVDEVWRREMLVIKGELCVRKNKLLKVASSLESVLVYYTYYFLTQPFNFSDSDNQDLFYNIWPQFPSYFGSKCLHLVWVILQTVSNFCLIYCLQFDTEWPFSEHPLCTKL